jgi:hypothetical protein
MIKILNKFELDFIEFLNDKHFTDQEVKLSILHNYDCVGGKDDTGFAVYIPHFKTIMLPTEVPAEIGECANMEDIKVFIISNLAHEYKHFLQDVNGEEFDEDEANKFADEVVEEYMGN